MKVNSPIITNRLSVTPGHNSSANSVGQVPWKLQTRQEVSSLENTSICPSLLIKINQIITCPESIFIRELITGDTTNFLAVYCIKDSIDHWDVSNGESKE